MTGWNLLLIDEDEEFVSTLAERLLLRGAIVRTSPSIDQAFVQIESCRPHAVILSLGFEGLAALDMIHRLKIGFPEITIVAVANLGKNNDMRQSLRLGAHHCLMKPFQIEELLEVLAETVQCP